MDVTRHRLDLHEKRAGAADARMARIDEEFSEILAKVATKDDVATWGVLSIAAVLITWLFVGAMFLQSSRNQLRAFQAGLSAMQAITASEQPVPAKPGVSP
jgi:hypothetical protein